mmetsp:Transcript_7898/g.19402  ORF Transcript_7898/g.19402 Transcript_7898/m.19402 type:complete len:185 (-) Transcript_7898:228-782(-)
MFARTLSLLSLLVLAQLASFANAQTTIEVTDWVVPYNGPTEWQASVGDTIVFTWEGGHNVFIHPTLSCNIAGAIRVGAQTGTSYTFTEFDGDSQMFFACDIGQGAHCRFGQSITVLVYSGPAPGGSGVVPDEPVVLPEPEPVVATEAPVMDTDTDASESMSAASLTSVVSLAGLVGAALALVLV